MRRVTDPKAEEIAVRGVHQELELLRGRAITWDQFVRRTCVHWDRLAKHLDRRWVRSDALEVEDLRQELLMGALLGYRDYNPDHPRAPKLAVHVVWRAVAYATRALHHDRHAGRDRKGPARHTIAECRLFNLYDADHTMQLEQLAHLGPPAMPDQHAAMQRRDALACARTDEERNVVGAIVAGMSVREVTEVYGGSHAAVTSTARIVLARMRAA